jgi:osmotically-inducible protein OsmY
MGGLGSLLGCLIAATGCASDQEARRNETTTVRERNHDHREARRDRDHDHDRNGDGVRDDRDAVAANDGEALDDSVAVKPVPIAGGENVRDNVGDKERVSDNLADKDRVADRDRAADRDNVRDGDNNRTDSDRQLTSRIRESIVADDQLSTKAKNVEIISKNGAVTLRGPVGTAAEKSRVATHAQNQAGAKRVNNEIEVTR